MVALGIYLQLVPALFRFSCMKATVLGLDLCTIAWRAFEVTKGRLRLECLQHKGNSTWIAPSVTSTVRAPRVSVAE
jgi:hypothetical protein